MRFSLQFFSVQNAGQLKARENGTCLITMMKFGSLGIIWVPGGKKSRVKIREKAVKKRLEAGKTPRIS